MLEGGKWNRPPKGRNPALHALLAGMGLVNTTQALAETRTPVFTQLPKIASHIAPKAMNEAWFKVALKKRSETAGDLKRMEDLMLSDGIHLGLQISFMEKSFGAGGHFSNEFFDKRLTAERLSMILTIAERFSARLNRAYGLKDKVPASIPLFDQVPMLEAATKVIRVPDDHGSFCNSFFYEDEMHEIRQDTAAHCGITDLIKMGYTVSREGSDVSTRVVPNPAAAGIRDADSLPIMRPMTFAEMYGKVGVSVSWSPRGDKKVHFSVVMPLTERVQELSLVVHTDDPASYYRGRVFILKPQVEGKVINKNSLTNKVVLEASGSSGSLIAIAGPRVPFILGSFTDEKILADSCTQLCYAISIGNNPEVHAQVRQQERAERGAAWFAGVKDAMAPAKGQAAPKGPPQEKP